MRQETEFRPLEEQNHTLVTLQDRAERFQNIFQNLRQHLEDSLTPQNATRLIGGVAITYGVVGLINRNYITGTVTSIAGTAIFTQRME